MLTKEDRDTIDQLVLQGIRDGRDETCLLQKQLEEKLDEAIVKRHEMARRHSFRAVYDYLVDASLRRLKRRKLVTFDKKKRVWVTL